MPETTVVTDLVRFDPATNGIAETFKANVDKAEKLCEALTVWDQDSLELASGMLANCRTSRASWERHYESMRKPAYDAYQAVMANIKLYKSGYQRLEAIIEPKILAYVEQTKAEHVMIVGEVAASNAQLTAELEADIAELKEAGDFKTARELRAQLDNVVEAVPQQTAPIANSSLTPIDKWAYEITDQAALEAAIGKGERPREYEYRHGKKEELRPLLVVDSAVLNYLVKKQGDKLDLPGVRVFEKTSLRRKS